MIFVMGPVALVANQKPRQDVTCGASFSLTPSTLLEGVAHVDTLCDLTVTRTARNLGREPETSPVE